MDYENYILDLFVGENEEDTYLVELNSFESWTGSCLFSWNLDRETLLNGPFEFRLVQSAPEIDIDDYIPAVWKKIVLERLGGWITTTKEEVPAESASKCLIS